MKYNSIDTIPARIFFEILTTKNLQLLKPKPSEQGLDEVFTQIYDDWFIKSDNPNAKQFLKLTNSINFMEHKIRIIKRVVKYIASHLEPAIHIGLDLKSLLNDLLDALVKGCEIYVDKETATLDELERILSVEIGILENDLNVDKIVLESMKGKENAKAFNYYRQIVELSNAHGRNMDENMTLARYIEEEKSAIEKNKPKR